MSRFFTPQHCINNGEITVTGGDLNHIKNVLRKNIGDKIVCFGSSGIEYETELISAGRSEAKLKILKERHKEVEPNIKVTLAQSLPKSSKMDDIIQKSTELGVFEIIPLITERSVPRSDKNDRWNKIARESAEQSGRVHIPNVRKAVTLEELLGSCSDYGLKILPWECENKTSIRTLLAQNKDLSSILLLIGPEGGFSATEAQKASEKGFKSVSLGKRILRTQTAGPAALAMIVYEMEME